MTIPHQDCTKTITALIHQFCYQGIKKPSHRTWLSQNPTKINYSFCNQTFHTSFFIICHNSPPKFHKNHNFTYSPILLPRQKKPIHRTWLSQNPTKINSFCNKLFTPQFWCICDNSAPRLHKNNNFTYSPILLPRQKKVNPPNLAKPKRNQDQLFLLQPNFSHLIFDAFVTIPNQDCTKTITALIHQFCYQGIKNPSHRTCLSQNPTKINYSFCNQTFHTSFFMHLWQFPTKIAQKP